MLSSPQDRFMDATAHFASFALVAAAIAPVLAPNVATPESLTLALPQGLLVNVWRKSWGHYVGDNNDVSEKTMMEEENGCQKKEEDEMNNQQVLKTMMEDENGCTVIALVQRVLPQVDDVGEEFG